MKNFIIASAMTVASVLSVAPQSQAASVTVVTDEMAPRHHDRDYRRDYVSDDYRHHRPHHDCMVKKVKTYHNGHVTVKETRVCR